jgi:hypothetical protein
MTSSNELCGAALTGLAAETTPEKIHKPTHTQINALHAMGVEWRPAPHDVDQCFIKESLVGFVVGGSMEPEFCDAFLELSDGDRSVLITEDEPVDRPTARLILLGRLADAFLAGPDATMQTVPEFAQAS